MKKVVVSIIVVIIVIACGGYAQETPPLTPTGESTEKSIEGLHRQAGEYHKAAEEQTTFSEQVPQYHPGGPAESAIPRAECGDRRPGVRGCQVWFSCSLVCLSGI